MLLDSDALLKADVLKVADHGEGHATSNELVAQVSPRLAVISTNTEDEPDTPDPRVLKLLASRSIPVLVTQDSQDGVLITLRDGEILTEIR